MPDNVVSLLIQIPLVGAFMWFFDRLVSKHQAEIDRRDQQWRDFLREERTQLNRNTDAIVGQLNALSENVTANTQILLSHDKQTAEYIASRK